MEPLNVVLAPLESLISIIANCSRVVGHKVGGYIDVPRAECAVPLLPYSVEAATERVPARLCVLEALRRGLLRG